MWRGMKAVVSFLRYYGLHVFNTHFLCFHEESQMSKVDLVDFLIKRQNIFLCLKKNTQLE